MPTNLYGPGDDFALESSHVVPALMRKFHEAASSNVPCVTLWGAGTPRREFLHVDDLSGACLFLTLHCEGEEIINVEAGEDVSIGELVAMIREVAGYRGEIVYDRSKPGGTPRKLLDVTRVRAMGGGRRFPFGTVSSRLTRGAATAPPPRNAPLQPILLSSE